MKYKLITFKQFQFFCFNAIHNKEKVECWQVCKRKPCNEKRCPYWNKLDFGEIKRGKVTDGEL